jgi:hypothetical protein
MSLLASSYERMNDRDSQTVATAVCAAKFCSMGIVSSSKWYNAYIVIGDGVVKLYDSLESYQTNLESHILKISLTHNHSASEISRKNYSNDANRITEFFCFNVQIENGMFPPTKEVKLGFLDRNTAERIRRTVLANSRGM